MAGGEGAEGKRNEGGWQRKFSDVSQPQFSRIFRLFAAQIFGAPPWSFCQVKFSAFSKTPVFGIFRQHAAHFALRLPCVLCLVSRSRLSPIFRVEAPGSHS